MRYNTFVNKVRKVLPEAQFGFDSDNQIVIYTNKMLIETPPGKGDLVVDYQPSED